MMEMKYHKIAIVKLSAMGDIIHAMVALQFIKKKYPNLEIDWFVERSFSEVLKYNKDINNVYEINLKSIKKDKIKLFQQIKLINQFSKKKYDLIIDAQGLIKSAIVAKLLGKNIAGFDRNSIREKFASIFYNQKINISYDENTIDRNVRVLSEPLNFHIDKNDILNKKAFLFFENEDKLIYEYFIKDKKNILFVISSTWESRNYPKEKFVNIANKLKENILVIWGNQEEKEKADFIANNSQYVKVLPKCDLNTLKAVISKCDLVIGNDTGPTHMAWALNIPSITIFGPTPANRIYETNINKLIKSVSNVNHFKLNKNDFSINEIKEDDIIELAKGLL